MGLRLVLLFAAAFLLAAQQPVRPQPAPAPHLDLAPFAQLSTWDGAEVKRLFARAEGGTPRLSNIGLEWDEERDVRELRARYENARPAGVTVEYWFQSWPYPPVKMPTTEDPVDDPWQGEWRAARASEECEGYECHYTFAPLTTGENPQAANLPGVRYRRTLKVRLAFGGQAGAVSWLRAFSESTERPLAVRVELGAGEPQPAEWSGAVEVYNGYLRGARPWRFTASDDFGGPGRWRFRTDGGPKGLLLDLTVSQPAPPGSNDVTVVTIRARANTGRGAESRTFSVSAEDLRRGSVRIPDLHACVADASQPACAPPPGLSPRIRSMIPLEPEQSYERASREIPPLDPWEREYGDRVYLPLAADSSWQKFAFDYAGNIFISKRGTKAKGAEFARLQWAGDRITWEIGTGETPYFREDRRARISVLDGFLPLVTETWESEGLRYSEEAFATLLHGPLSPNDPGRSEATPAVLMLRLTAENRGAESRAAHVWLAIETQETLRTENGRVLAVAGKEGAYSEPRLRALLHAPGGAAPGVARLPGSSADAVHLVFEVPAGSTRSTVIKLPFVSDLAGRDAEELGALHYQQQRNRIVAYWRAIAERTARFAVPEPRFNELLRSIPVHVHISTTRDPRSGLSMVPAASYTYQVYANEACFQILLLDALGDAETARNYLETLLRLQGSRDFPGLHRGPPDAIFHGARVDEVYDYTAHHYGLDHGTVLWTLAEHFLYTRDRAWFERAWPHVRRAIDWIVEQRAATRRTGEAGAKVREYGLLPASHLEDNNDWAHWFSINAFAWAGLDRTARALRDIGHPEAGRVRREADAYRADLRAAVERAVESAPVIRTRDGNYAPYVPVQPWQRFRRFGPMRVDYYRRLGPLTEFPLLRLSATREVLYGPMILLSLGVFEPGEPIAGWILDDWEDNLTLTSGLGLNVHGLTDDRYWFSQGGMVFQSNLQNPILVYLKRREIPAALRALYNNLAACLYPEVNAFTEEYHMWRRAAGPFYKSPDEARFLNRLRDMLVLEDGETLWLAGGVPRRWLESKEGVRVDGVMSHFGPVSYTLRAGAQPGRIEAVVQLPVRNPAERVMLAVRVPRGVMRAVTINGRSWAKFDVKQEVVQLPRDRGSVRLAIDYR